ncbi:MAG: hypothetical protein R3B82_06605 [Sandaracinaceae bacterium]
MRLRWIPLVLSLGAALTNASCISSTRSGGRRTTPAGGYTAACRGDFGASAAASQFEAFMGATYDFHQAAQSTESSLRDTCSAMATELGISPAGPPGPEGTRAICEAVATHLRAEMQAIGEGSDIAVEVRAEPPRCEARFDAYADCAARCEVSVEPAQVELACTGGRDPRQVHRYVQRSLRGRGRSRLQRRLRGQLQRAPARSARPTGAAPASAMGSATGAASPTRAPSAAASAAGAAPSSGSGRTAPVTTSRRR